MKIFVLVLAVYTLISTLSCENERKWKLMNHCNANNTIVYYKGVSKTHNDTIHLIYGVGDEFKLFSGLIIVSEDNFSVHLNCSSADDVVSYSGDRRASYGLVFTKVIEFNDERDRADMNLSKQFNISDFSDFKWDLKLLNSSSHDNSFVFNTSRSTNNLFNNNGSITIQVNISNTEKYSEYLPGLRYSGDNSIFDLSLDKLYIGGPKSRFGLEVALISEHNSFKLSNNKTMDDQKSPGVFQTNTLLSKYQNETSGYLQWKPVCYTNEAVRNLNSLSSATQDKLESLKPDAINNSLVYMFYKGQFSGRTLNISFGMTGDKWYNRTNYVVWSGSFGVGKPLVAEMSSTLILVIILGLGLPFLLVVIGSVYLFIKRHLRRSDNPGSTGNYDSIN